VPPGTELDEVFSQSILEILANELTASVALGGLDGKGKLAQKMVLHKVRRVEGAAR
jgi:hypothetical protein